MTQRLLTTDQIRALPTPGARARAVRAYFDTEKEMRRLREEVARQLRADGVSVKDASTELGCSEATVKIASRGTVDS